MIEVSPVVVFNGNCEEAFGYYKSVFGGEYQFLYRYKDVSEADTPDGYAEKILHVSLPLMKNVNLMGSDVPGSGGAVGRMQIGLRLNDKDETFRIFDMLADSGKVQTPLAKVFYADYYGVLTDKFGVVWSFNCNLGREAIV